MSSSTKKPAGQIGWLDLTVPDAEKVRDFYAGLFGWQPDPVNMDGYSDFNMLDPESGQPQAGVCHRRGENASLPPVWMVYFTVPDLEAAMTYLRSAGGEVIDGPRGGFCIFRDPGGAVAALFEVP